MIEMTQAQYRQVFNCSNHDPMFLTILRQFSEEHGVSIKHFMRPIALPYPIVYLDWLPPCAERRLAVAA